MTDQTRKAIMFVPFWRQPNHVGNHRIDRFLRSLVEEGYTVIVIRAGSRDGEQLKPWGREITVRDRLGLYRGSTSGSGATSPPRKSNRLRRWLAYWLFNPDPTVLWARTAAKHPNVLQAMQGSHFILSSSPPESAHVGAWKLSRLTNIPHIVDMRDGWLDEPLKPLLLTSTFRRWKERRLEAPILKHARLIQVTSELWKELLCKRYPDLADRVLVLSNAYPQQIVRSESRSRKTTNGKLLLVHAGRFIGSQRTRLPNLLLAPLLENLRSQSPPGIIELLGPLSQEETVIIQPFKSKFRKIGWRIECPGRLPHNKVLNRLQEADGLLLLSVSLAAVPTKLFEYIFAQKPIFVVAKKNSAVWNLCNALPQAKLVEIGHPSDCEVKEAPFYLNRQYDVPLEYSEDFLKRHFTDNVSKIVA